MLERRQFLEEVIRPTLKFLEPEIPHSVAAEQLLMGTALQESKLTYLVQLGNGPAKGLFQMEPQTHDDIWDNFLAYNARIKIKLQKAFGDCFPDRMVTDLMYAAAMCRIHYWRVPQPLPEAGDWSWQAAYWKQHYNTPLGKGTMFEYEQSLRRVSADQLWQ